VQYASSEAARLLRDSSLVDLVVGSVLFRDSFVRGGRGQVDLPRLRAVGMNVVGLTIATAWPDLRGSLSRWHFRSLGMPGSVLRSRMAMAEWLIERVKRWESEADGAMRVIRSRADLEACLVPGGPVGVLLGVQGGHVLDGDLGNIARLRALGVRMFAPAHLMDNALVGSGTGRLKTGITDYGREVIAALEDQAVIVDLAHMSVPGVVGTLPLLRRPFVLSHTGLVEAAGRGSRWRRYSAATRNIPASLAAEIGAAGGLLGITLSSQLLGGSSLAAAVRTIQLAIESAGTEHVALGSDMDGALGMLIDVEGLPALADALLASDLAGAVVGGVLGGNAARFMATSLP
jgi:membrane dipeptidase